MTYSQQLVLGNEMLLPLHGQDDASFPAVAMGNSNALVVWQSGFNEKSTIVGIRMNAHGQKIDSLPFVICDAVDAQEQPKVAFNNGIYYVLWNDLRNGKDYDVYGARISETGVVLDENGVVIADGARNQRDPSVCAQGAGFYIVWRAFFRDTTSLYYDCYKIRSRVLSSEGVQSAVDSIPFVKVGTNTEINSGVPVLKALGNDRTLLMFPSVVNRSIPRQAVSLRLIQDGNVSTANVFGSSLRAGHEMAAATDGVNAMMIWGNYMVTGGRGGVSAGGMALVPLSDLASAPTMSVPYPAEGGNRPTVIWDGYDYITAWQLFMTTGNLPYDVLKVKAFSSEGVARAVDVVAAGVSTKPASNCVVTTDGKGTSFLIYESHPATGDVPIKIAVKTIVNPRGTGIDVNGLSSALHVNKFFCTPNPFSTSAQITLTGVVAGTAQLNSLRAEIFTLQGRKVASLLPDKVSIASDKSGELSYVWNGMGAERAEGVYMLKIRYGKQVWNGRLVYLK
jgi:hypothetical protein